jgi:hypothetical protein
MELIRWGNSYTRKEANNCDLFDEAEPDAKRGHLDFRGFGRGSERNSSFSVEIKWADIEVAISNFAQLGHPEAIRLRNALSLAAAAEEAGWHGDQTPSN